MTIEKGQEWGEPVVRRPGAVTVEDDAALVDALGVDGGSGPDREVVVTGGDLWRTLGAPRPDAPARRYPIDLLEVDVGEGATWLAAAHVVAREPWRRGGWLRGRILVVMNAEFIGDWDVAPRGHPNDGRVETFDVEATLALRQRLAVRRRLPSATHLPHPAIVTRSVREHAWSFDRPLEIWIDGRRRARADQLHVRVRPDAAAIVA